jgi:conserved oligomeric Golgi complex subunit 7
MVIFQNTHSDSDGQPAKPTRGFAFSSALVAAINSIFSVIQRESKFRKYYYGSRRALLVATWQEANLTRLRNTACGQLPIGETAQTSSQSFTPPCHCSISNVHFSSPFFPDPQSTLSALIMSVCSPTPPFSQRIASLLTTMARQVSSR